ncbi:MAG TPA: glucoamylase family protein [Rhodanobacteraceae bacterium]|nr:glucoamylase family protein [Rhodanobacteraceae bacterium]
MSTRGPSAATVPHRRGRNIERDNDSDDAIIDDLERKGFHYFERHVNPANGLVLDSTRPSQPASIAAVGFALAAYPVAVERGWLLHRDALAYTLAALRFFDSADQSGARDGIGYKGFFYHFLDPASGRRAWQCELSTIDTALLVAGMLVAAQYFSADTPDEREVRMRVQSIYARVDWRWAQNGQDAIVLGWKPESGFLVNRWLGYNEALILYVLALAAPDHRVTAAAYRAWTSTFKWRRLYGHNVLYAGPLFIHQFSHIFIDTRGIRDAFMADKHTDYFENSRVATHIQREYARRNPRRFRGYEKNCWGFSATDGPGNVRARYRGRYRQFFDYTARGAPFGPDDGTISPWSAIASLPFAPQIVLDEIRHLETMLGHSPAGYGFHASFNLSYPEDSTTGVVCTFDRDKHMCAWVSPWHFALHQGPIVLMIENHRSGMLWELMRDCAPIRLGLERAGFTGGWLG